VRVLTITTSTHDEIIRNNSHLPIKPPPLCVGVVPALY
jgi:hypothetical protein